MAVKKADRYSIIGHRDGSIYGLNGEIISAAAMNLRSEKLNQIASFQLQKKQKGELIVRVIPFHKLSQKDMDGIRTVFQNQAGVGLKVEIQPVDEMILTLKGKFKLLI